MQYITLQRPCPSSNLYRWSTIITTVSLTNNHVNISVSNQRWKDVVFESSSMLLQYWYLVEMKIEPTSLSKLFLHWRKVTFYSYHNVNSIVTSQQNFY